MIDPFVQISAFNLLLCLTIFVLGIFHPQRKKQLIVLYIAYAFGMFGISHLINILGLSKILFIPKLLIRSSAYSLMLYGIYPAIKIVLAKASKNILHAIKLLKIKKLNLNQIFIAAILLILFLSILFNFLQLFFTYFVYKTSEINLRFFNLSFCLLIVSTSYIAYKIKKLKTYYYIAISYLLFSISHATSILIINNFILDLLILVRISAYIFSLAAIYIILDKKLIEKILANALQTKNKIIIVIASIFMILIFFYFPHTTFKATDPMPKIHPIKPVLFEEDIIEIHTGLLIKNFPVFDVTNNQFTMDGVLWFKFDPRFIPLDTVENFSFSRGEILYKSKPKTKIIRDKLFVRYKIKVSFKSSLDFTLFPLEDHKIYISLINTNVNPNEVVMITYNTDFYVDSKIFTNDWHYLDSNVFYGYTKSEVDKYDQEKTSFYPTIIFELNFSQAGIKESLIIFLPLFAAFFLSLFALILDVKNIQGITSLAVGGISAFIVDLFVIQRMSPNVRYFTIADTIYTLLLINVFIIFIFSVYFVRGIQAYYHVSKSELTNIIIIKNYLFICSIVFILISVYYILYHSI